MTDRDKLERAPERIWLSPTRFGDWHAVNAAEYNCGGDYEEYVLADLFTALQAERDALREALRSISEGNLGDASWQANYDRIWASARAALHQSERDE